MTGSKITLVVIVSALLASGYATGIGVAFAQSGDTLKEAEQKLEEARQESERLKRESDTLNYDLNKIRREMISLARSAQARESEITRIEARLKELGVLEKRQLEALSASEGGMSRVLAALVRMSRNPPGAMLFQPTAPADTVRGAILLRATVPAIEEKATRLKRDLLELVHARKEMIKRHDELEKSTLALADDQMNLDRLLEMKTMLKRETDEDQKKAEREVRILGQKAKDLRDLLGKIQESKKEKQKAVASVPATPEPGSASRVFSQSRGLVPYPVSGRVVGKYGEKLESGLARKGLSLETRPGAQVIAPFDGRVVFAGPFRGYGHLLIIEHGEGYHTLLAGMARIDVALDQAVLAGEPVGVMDASQSGEGDLPILYVELRRDSQPINPTPWLQARREDANG